VALQPVYVLSYYSKTYVKITPIRATRKMVHFNDYEPELGHRKRIPLAEYSRLPRSPQEAYEQAHNKLQEQIDKLVEQQLALPYPE